MGSSVIVLIAKYYKSFHIKRMRSSGQSAFAGEKGSAYMFRQGYRWEETTRKKLDIDGKIWKWMLEKQD
jgi:hypothetical protein